MLLKSPFFPEFNTAGKGRKGLLPPLERRSYRQFPERVSGTNASFRGNIDLFVKSAGMGIIKGGAFLQLQGNGNVKKSCLFE